MHEGQVVDEGGPVQVESSATLMALNSSEIDTQIATAKKYPRSIKSFIDESTQMVTLNEEIAADCRYALPRDGKTIEGPSARFAEIVVSAWGNCRAGARIVNEDAEFVTAQGVFLDLQRNTAITYEVKRRITNKRGQRFKPDMIGVTSNAACSIALRNAVLKGIPKAFWSSIDAAARKTALGDARTLSSRRASMLQHFQKMGVQPDQVFAKIGVAGEADITLEDLLMLKGLATAIKDGDTTIDDAFNLEPPRGGKVGKSDLDAATEPTPPESDEAAPPMREGDKVDAEPAPEPAEPDNSQPPTAEELVEGGLFEKSDAADGYHESGM